MRRLFLDDVVQLEKILIKGDRAYSTASSKSIREFDLNIRPMQTAQDMLQLAPGLVVAQHAGGGKVDEPSDANEIPLAPRVTSTGGLTAAHPSGFGANLRYRYIGDRPANEDSSVTAEGYTLVNIGLSYAFGPFKYFVTVENLFDVDWNEAQFDTASRLVDEAEPVSEIHFTPGNPRNIQAGISYQF